MEPICPGCKKQLKKTPQKKTKCPHCGVNIYLRRTPEDEEKKLVTEEEKDRIDQEWSSYYSQKEMEQKMESLYHYGLNAEEVDNIKKDLYAKFGYEPVYRDILWAILNKLILLYKEYGDLKWVYDQMALLVNQEGRNCYELQVYSNKCYLYQLIEVKVYTTVTVKVSDEHNCKACKTLKDRIYKITDILNDLPIPSRNCTNYMYSNEPYCTCYFSPD